MISPDLTKKFLTHTDDTGRFIVKSARTGRTYYVEPIEHGRPPEWGSVDPATGDLMNKKGAGKYRGAIDEKDSLITKENGFEKIHILEKGMSPLAYIDHLDAKYPDAVA